jgi:radical SAM superfamily enzyme YgiQ (UPF0313 family)
MMLTPDQPLRCLFIQPKFEESNFWNFVEGARAIGARATAPPLGLLTVAALLPQHWQMRLVDLNVEPLSDQEWQWADIILTGGMLPQQAGILEVVQQANRDGKYVVLGGPDPTSQPELYASADALVIGEGESSIPVWLDSWRAGQPKGRFEPNSVVDITQTPLPRFDLIHFENYLNAGIQSSRGCPYNCEFCDVIELFGRKPRVKSPEQFVSELQNLYDSGYRGWVDIHDDNFIGNRLKIRPVLEAAAEWMKQHNYPFVLSTEASTNLADDTSLLELMRQCQFRYVFLGIETPDPKVLKQTQKSINTVKPLIDRIRTLYSYGISVTAGFILGFDSEPENVDESLIPFIQESGISMAMVGLLFAMPNTQLTRRLRKEGRLVSHADGWVKEFDGRYNVVVSGSGVDHTATGLNFITMRDRVDIYREIKAVIDYIYSPQAFMDRVLDTTQRLQFKTKHRPGWWEAKRMVRGFFNISSQLLRSRSTRRLYLRNAWKSMWMGLDKFEYAHTTMGGYMHFKKQADLMSQSLARSIELYMHQPPFPRSVGDMANSSAVSLPVISARQTNCCD